jgi:murein L,D-transpeptidase YcbB/YkuD
MSFLPVHGVRYMCTRRRNLGRTLEALSAGILLCLFATSVPADAQNIQREFHDSTERQSPAGDGRLQSPNLDLPLVGYLELRKALERYTQLAREDDDEKLPLPADFGYPGPPYAGVNRLTRLLRRLGDLPSNYSVGPRVYDAALVMAVRRFQERHGLPTTGYLDTATIEQLNVPLSHRVEQIQLALDRFRGMSYKIGRPTIIVNIPALRLYAFDGDGKVALTMGVAVGDDFEDSRTPVLQDTLEYLVFRPYWDVPLSIQKQDFVPFLAHEPAWLAENHFEFVTAGRKRPAGVVTKQILQGLRSGKVRIRQRPGPDNPLGTVKFMFPNRYGVYLHDVPERQFQFILPQRLVSHGCVHVEKPAELAAWVLRGQPGWNLERVQHAMKHGQNNLNVYLRVAVPVLIIYSTVSTAENGDIYFYPDIYGYDGDRKQVLAKGSQ